MFLTGRGTLASCPHQEETRDKQIPVAAARSGPLAGELVLEYPEWLSDLMRAADVSCSKNGVPSWLPVVVGSGPPSRATRVGSCLTLGNELSEETHVLTKQEILLGKGT